jgi:serine/threonine protein kinase
LKIQSACNHPNICQLYGYFLDAENLYIMQELCTEGQLFDLLKKRNRIDEDQASFLIRQVLEGIRYLHVKCIIHRDIKP